MNLCHSNPEHVLFSVYTGALGCPRILAVLLQEIKLQGTAFMSLKRGLLMISQTIPLEDLGAQDAERPCQRVRNGLRTRAELEKEPLGAFLLPKGCGCFRGTLLPPQVYAISGVSYTM